MSKISIVVAKLAAAEAAGSVPAKPAGKRRAKGKRREAALNTKTATERNAGAVNATPATEENTMTPVTVTIKAEESTVNTTDTTVIDVEELIQENDHLREEAERLAAKNVELLAEVTRLKEALYGQKLDKKLSMPASIGVSDIPPNDDADVNGEGSMDVKDLTAAFWARLGQTPTPGGISGMLVVNKTTYGIVVIAPPTPKGVVPNKWNMAVKNGLTKLGEQIRAVSPSSSVRVRGRHLYVSKMPQ